MSASLFNQNQTTANFTLQGITLTVPQLLDVETVGADEVTVSGPLSAEQVTVTAMGSGSVILQKGTINSTGKVEFADELDTVMAYLGDVDGTACTLMVEADRDMVIGTNGVNRMTIESTGTVALSTLNATEISTATLSTVDLDVSGTSSFAQIETTDLVTSTITATGPVSLGATIVTGTASVSGAATVGSLSSSGTAALGNTTVTGTANVSGLATVGSLSSGSTALGNTTVTGTASVSGVATVGSLSTSGTAALGNTTVTGTANVSGAATAGSLSVSGASALNSTSVSNLTVASNLTVTGATFLPSGASIGTNGIVNAPTFNAQSASTCYTGTTTDMISNAFYGYVSDPAYAYRVLELGSQRAASSAFSFIDCYANGTSQFKVGGAGAVTTPSTIQSSSYTANTSGASTVAVNAAPTNASYTGTALKATVTRAANTAFSMIDCLANSVSVFKVLGDGGATGTSFTSLTGSQVVNTTADIYTFAGNEMGIVYATINNVVCVSVFGGQSGAATYQIASLLNSGFANSLTISINASSTIRLTTGSSATANWGILFFRK